MPNEALLKATEMFQKMAYTGKGAFQYKSKPTITGTQYQQGWHVR